MTGVIIGISLSWKYGKINNIKCPFLSQMFTISGIHVIHIHELKKVMAIKPPSLWAFQVLQISQLSTMTNWISFCYTLHNKRHATASRDNLWTRNRCQQPRTGVHQKRRHTQRWRFKSLFRSFAVDPILIGMQINLHKTYFWYAPISDRHNSRYRDTLTA